MIDRSMKLRKAVQLKFLHKFWLSGIPPAAAGGSFNPGLQGARNALESRRRQPVGLRRIFRVLGSLGLNNPPAAAGGILVNITCVETLAGPLCATVVNPLVLSKMIFARGPWLTA